MPTSTLRPSTPFLLPSPAPATASAWPTWLAAGLIVVTAALRLIYLANWCPLDLSPDEAHYWDWSRHLDWSYYSKGPGVAFLIRASCALFGETMPAVRLPAVLCGALTLWGLFVLTRRVYGSERLALAAVALGLTLPVLAAGSLLMTIDAPYVACWTWALVVARQQIRDAGEPKPQAAGWVGLGLIVGAGILAKYTMVLFLPSLGLFLLTSAKHRSVLGRPGFWIMAAVAGFSCLPILIWNAQNGWVTFLHVGRQAGVTTGPALQWLGPLEYVGTQAAVLLGFWFVVWAAAMAHALRHGNADERFLFWLSAPMFLVFLGFSVKTRTEPNWPITAYLSGLVLGAGWLAANLHRRWVRWGTVAAAGLGLMGTLLLHQTEWAYPLHDALRPDVPVRRWDATCRLRGWQTLGEAIGQTRERLRAEGVEPLLAGGGWNLPGEIGFYQPDHPPVYSFGLATGGRHSQYDVWRPNPISDPADFRGATFVYVGELTPTLAGGFEAVGSTVWVTHRAADHAVANWPITVLRGFKGFPEVTGGGH